MVTESEVRKALGQVQDPEHGQSIIALGMVRDLEIQGGKVTFTLALTNLACPFKDRMVNGAREAIQSLEGVKSIDIYLAEMTAKEKAALTREDAPKSVAEKLNDVKHVIAIMSGKGGVGKSLVTGLLATSMRRMGHKVGILDADITGPSIPKMFFKDGARPEASPMALLPPKTRTGISIMSINLLLESEDQAVIWRGPLISNTIKQFWTEVLWGDLDYLLVDLPPGTSDASLTVLQSLPMSGVVLVTSPQNLAGMVVRKAANMVRDIGIPILGLLENMSYFVCPDTGAHHEIFGKSNPEDMASELGMPFLGCLPIDPLITSLCDRGEVESYPGDLFEPFAGRIVELAPAASSPKMQKHSS
ncbi:MAG: Mrp/NBP35 family ATP-binding protein [Acidobacteria bacterium]|nr:Mrp/NBP35 family ATP-binding protein [Acidobacteriota bacterium]